MNKKPRVSIVIPTYNRSDQLIGTIQSFARQDLPAEAYELIISNNNSSDDTEAKIKDLMEKMPDLPLTYIFERRQGVHYARNSAAKVARGEILYFTDDDMLATPDLLENLLSVFHLSSNIACATGPVLPQWETTPPAWILRHCNNYLLSLIDRPESLIIAPYDMGCYSCHQAIRKEVFFKTCGFHPENTAGVWLGDGETGLNQTIKCLGYDFAYTSKSVIYHCIPKSRMTQSYLNKRLYNQGFCDSYSEYRIEGGRSKRKVLLSIAISLACCVKHILGALAYLVLAKSEWHLSVGNFWYHIGKVNYKTKLLVDKKWQQLVLKNNWLDE